MTDPLGVRNANPLNIRSGQPYEGLMGVINGFCVFQSPVWGFRAAFRNYITKSDRGINTIRKLISEWAPTSENDTAAYISSVCASAGYGPDDVIALKTWDVASKVCYAQTIVECGAFEQYFTQAQMAEGAFRAGIVDAPPTFVHRVKVTVAAAASSVAGAAGGINEVVQSAQPTVTQGHHTLTVIFAVTSIVLGALAAFWNVRNKIKGAT